MKLKREAFGECIAEVGAQAGVSDDEAFDIIQKVADHGEKMRASGEANPFGAAAEELSARDKEAAAKDRADALRNALIRNGITDRIRESGGLGNAELTLRSLLHGTNKGERDSVQALWRGNASLWTGVLSNKLHALGLEKAAISGELDEDISRALWAMNAKEPVPADVNVNAKQIAEAIHPMLELARDRLNGAGARIGDPIDYVSHTSHDARAIRQAAGPGQTPEAAFSAWWAKTRALLADKTFEGVETKDGESTEDAYRRFGKSVFEALVSGVHMTQRGAFGIDPAENFRAPPAFEGSYNIARKASQPRVLFWKDGAAWNSYMQDFGAPKTLSQGVFGSLDRSARQVALMEKFGTNPAGNLNLIIRKVQEEYRSDLDGLNHFQGKVEGLRNVMGRLDGALNIPVNEGVSRFNENLRTWESISSLGGVGLTHFASIWPTVSSELVHHGVPRLQSMGNLVGALLTGKGGAERQEILADLGAYSGGLNRDLQSKWQADDPIPGKISSIANTFMKYTGIHYVFENTQAAIREMLAHQLGRSTDMEYEALNPRLQNILGKYGIAKEDWDVLRATPDLPTAGGRAYMTPSAAYGADAGAVETLLKQRGEIADGASADTIDRAVKRYQWGLGDKLSSYYSDAAAHGVVTPGVQERAFILGSTRPGTLGGELLRYLAQFKVWPVAAMNQVLGREIYLATSKSDAAFNIGSIVALSMAGGYLRMSLNDLARGNPARDPRDPKTALAAIAQGGGIGILGDYLFGESNRMGGGVLSTLAGPVVGDAAALADIFNRFRDDAVNEDPDTRAKSVEHAWPELMRWGIKHIPFANLVYLKGALDYMLFYHAFEAASPGWWDRTNQRVQQQTGRTMMGYSPGAGVPVGVPGLYLGGNGGPATGLFGDHQAQP